LIRSLAGMEHAQARIEKPRHPVGLDDDGSKTR
jgi:hypothetical protein